MIDKLFRVHVRFVEVFAGQSYDYREDRVWAQYTYFFLFPDIARNHGVRLDSLIDQIEAIRFTQTRGVWSHFSGRAPGDYQYSGDGGD